MNLKDNHKERKLLFGSAELDRAAVVAKNATGQGEGNVQ